MRVDVLVALLTRTMYKVDLICNTLFVLLNVITTATTTRTMVLVILLGVLCLVGEHRVGILRGSSTTKQSC